MNSTKNHHHHLHKKKKIGLFYKVNFFLLLLASIVLFYFVVLVSIEPKSIPFVTNKITNSLKEKFGENVSLDGSELSFTRYGSLKVSISNLAIANKVEGEEKEQNFLIPKVEGEFSLLRFLLLNFKPTKLRLIDAKFSLGDLQKISQNAQSEDSDATLIFAAFSALKAKNIPVENFEIWNAKFLVKQDEIEREILLKKSQIKTSSRRGVFYISSINEISFDAAKSDVEFNLNCQLPSDDKAKCDMVLENFVTDSILGLSSKFDILSQIDAKLTIGASFNIEDGEFHNAAFEAKAKNGSFNFPDFFSSRLNFNNFAAKGEYHHKLGILNLSQVDLDFADHASSHINSTAKPHLKMSLIISELQNAANKNFDFHINLQDVSTNQIDRFWPITLNDNEVRNWFLTHIKNGVVKEADASFSLRQDALGWHLTKIKSQLNFSAFDLEYDKSFPAIFAIDGIANFSEKGMKISLTKGDVLQSKISNSFVEIEDFHAPKVMLKISGNLAGHSADGLRHVNHSPEFFTQLEKYLNGNSQSSFEIALPLQEKIALRDVYIAVNSKISGLKNSYANGDFQLQTKKDFASDSFISKLDLTALELVAKSFDLEKKSQIESQLSFALEVKNNGQLNFKNIELFKKEQNSAAKISGDLSFSTAPFKLLALNLKNENFGKNNYNFSYKADYKNSSQKIFLKGERLNLAPFLEAKIFPKGNGENFANKKIQLAVANLALLKGKMIKNFSLLLGCGNNFCDDFALNGTYKKNAQISFKDTKNSSPNSKKIEGKITDLTYLLEGFGISNSISGGEFKFDLENKISDKKQVLSGSITSSDNLTIFENEAVKRLAKNDLFSQIKDKIFSNNKTIFDSFKLEFELLEDSFNVKSLIANNYKIGITAKGAFNLQDYTYSFKGMIVPGFLINNLFGIGKIPLIGGVISGLLTGGEGGGVFGIRYEYSKKTSGSEPVFETQKVSSFVPNTIKSLFDLI